MPWLQPQFSRNRVNRAGQCLVDWFSNEELDSSKILRALDIINNWRACHGYPINTFQSTLRQKLKSIDTNAIVAQRLKRIPSIISKLNRFKNMQLARMQDIGGLRAIVSDLNKVRSLEQNYQNSRFKHELIASRDYITSPKESGYRSIHLIYRYNNPVVPHYNGLFVELQIRSQPQHTWATAVETAGTFLEHALKSSEGPEDWLKFFSLAGSAFAYLENTPPIPDHSNLSENEIFQAVVDQAHDLDVRAKLSAFAIAAGRVSKDNRPGNYHLVILNPEAKTVTINTFGKNNLDEAGRQYTEAERRIADGEPIQAVLVSAGRFENLRRAYPNYFLDTGAFLRKLNYIETRVRNTRSHKRKSKYSNQTT